MTPRFDLVDIAKTVQNRSRFIIIITIAAAAAGAVFHLLQKKKYKAMAEVIVSNPLFADRSNIFRTTEPRYVDYFAGEDDIDRVMALAYSDMVRNKVVENMHLFQVYKLSDTSREDQDKLGGRWKKQYKVMRTEYKNIEVSFMDTDPKIAADVANEAVRIIEESYRGYYNTIKNRINESLLGKIREADSAIAVLTDTLSALRTRYQIYDIISPARQNMIISNVRSGGGAEYGRGIEQVQNIESIKDQYVTDRAKYVSLFNEFATGTKLNDLRFLQTISAATPPIKPAGLGFVLTVIACTAAGFFLSVVTALIHAYYRALVTLQR